jgi:hypothetical protein
VAKGSRKISDKTGGDGDHTGDWALYAHHRARLTDAIVNTVGAKAAPAERLCLLGAGNCNDVELARLADRFQEIHLVDIDAAALARAVSRQTPEVRARLHCHGGVDLSALTPRLSAWRKQPPTFADVEATAASGRDATLARLPGPFDVVASTCVLTQMAFKLTEVLGDDHLMIGPIRQSLIAAHLGTLLGLAATGGAALFVCDLASSNFYPLDQLPPERDLREVMTEIVESEVFYQAANPTLIRRLLRRDDALRGRAGEPELLPPWLWTGPLDRTYLVYALRLQRQ